MFEDIVAFLARIEGATKIANRRRYEADQLDVLRRRHPGIPEDYLTFLQEVGSGAMPACRFALYAPFIEPSYFFGDRAHAYDASFVCFGHDYTSTQSGFRLDTWTIVEIHNQALTVVAESASGRHVHRCGSRARVMVGSSRPPRARDSSDSEM